MISTKMTEALFTIKLHNVVNIQFYVNKKVTRSLKKVTRVLIRDLFDIKEKKMSLLELIKTVGIQMLLSH